MDNFKKWAYEFKHKRTAALLMLTIILLVAVNNIFERENLSDINIAANAIYEDRFLPESYIFKYYQYTENVLDFLVENSLSDSQKQSLITQKLISIDAINTDYLKTKLTEKETTEINDLIAIYSDMKIAAINHDFALVKSLAVTSKTKLQSLSNIQLAEAETQINSIRKLNNSTMMSLKFEIFIILIIGLVAQALIFASKTIVSMPKTNEKSMWN